MPTHYKGNKTVTQALNAYINLTRAAESLLARLNGLLERENLTLGQFGVLESLLHVGPMCQSDLGQKLLRSGGNITVVIDNLERDGLVRRERQKDDRRKISIYLTARGRRLIHRIFPRHAKAIAREMGRLEPAEREELRRLCRKLGRGDGKLDSEKKRKEKDQ